MNHLHVNNFCQKISIFVRYQLDWKMLSDTFKAIACILTMCIPVLTHTSEHLNHRTKGNGHDFHKDHVAFLGEDAAREFEGLTQKESIRRLRY